MFGSLFDDERTAGVMTSVHTLPKPMPPNRRLPCGLSGIENQGATCYLNSLLQTLLYTPEFREGLFSLSDAELGSLENREKAKTRIIPLQLQRLFARLLLVDQQAASTTELTDSFGWSNNEELQQHDVQELNRILFSAIDSSLVGTSGKDLISELYHGSTITEIVCQVCGKISEREEDFLDLNVIVAGFNNLQDSLNATFLQTEIMKGKNQYRCSTCCNLVDAKKGLKIQCLPPILTLSLLRFSYDIAKGERFKETGKFTFPFEIDMAPYCSKEKKPEDTTYELFSVLIHSGCSSGGHYHAFIRDVDCLGKWLAPDEEASGNAGSGKDNNCNIQDPVVLIKAILSESEDRCLPMEFLSSEITKWSGMSWNKKFKSTFGTIAKFLQKHNDVFHYNSATNIVYLNAEAMVCDPPPDCSTASTSMDCTPNSPKESKKSAVINSLKLNIFDKKRVQNNFGSVMQNWFDFNDSRVSSILVKDIEKQFSGKESAYMLFYRRKSLVRPLEARGNPKYMMGDKLLKLVEEENSELEKLREEYELALNAINLQVHLGNNYKCTNGVLEPKPNEMNYLDLTIDKRKLLLDLRDSILKLCSEIYASQEFVLHTAREVPAGLHLYEELSESQNFESLKDLGILEGTKIFVWDGKQLGGEQFAIGVAHEPVLLNISVKLQNGETVEMSRGFPKTTTVTELKNLISNLVPLPLDDMRVSRLDLQGEETRLSPLNETHNSHTLSELSFIDGDNIIAESMQCNDNLLMKEISCKVTVIVQNCCQDFIPENCVNPQLAELTIDLDSTVEQLRLLAVSKLNLDNNRSFLLRKYIKSQSKRPPLHEHYTIREAGIVEASCLIIEEGEPPAPDQITIMFTVGIGLGDTVDFEVTVNKNMNVQECLRKMLCIAGLNGDAWHLRKTNWCGEPMEQLSLDGMTLEDESIQHGENLLIMEGRLPAKGFLNFSIWLFPTLDSINSQKEKEYMNGLHSGIENLLQSYGDSIKDDVNRSIKLGEVEISNESTVADLKKCILTLPTLSGLSLPNIRHLRLQILDNGRPGRVLRGLSNTLKKLKIQSQSLAARILYHEEDLMHLEILLNIHQRLPDIKQYTGPVEMVWETTKSSSPKALKQAIADCVGCPVQRVVAAKHFPEKCQWLIIDDGTSSKKNTRKKRWGAGKSNLRNSPYFIKDGDTIGVKDRLSDPDDQDDFLTSQDIEGQEILRIAAENKRIKRQEDKSPSRCGEWMLGGSDRELPRHAKKCEVGITIHVDDFT